MADLQNPQVTMREGLNEIFEKRTNVMRELAREISNDSSAPVLKGGTSLLLAHGLDRYSEDMDYDIERGKDIEIEKYVEKVMGKLGIEDYRINLKKDTETTKRFSLHYGARMPGREEYPLKIEFSKRTENILESDVEKKDGINVYAIRKLAENKAISFIDRNAPRDIFDISFLLSKHADKLSDVTVEAISKHVEDKKIDNLLMLFENGKKGDPYLQHFDSLNVLSDLEKGLESAKKFQEKKTHITSENESLKELKADFFKQEMQFREQRNSEKKIENPSFPETDELLKELKAGFEEKYKDFWKKNQEGKLTDTDFREVYYAAASVIQREVIVSGVSREEALVKHKDEGDYVKNYEAKRELKHSEAKTGRESPAPTVEPAKKGPELPRDAGIIKSQNKTNDKGRGSGGGMSI